VKGFEVVLAADEEGGIGRAGGLPWHLPGELARFKRLTTEAPPGRHNAVLMGRRTWESLPERFRPLPGRLNLVLSRSSGLRLPEGVLRASNLDEALERAAAAPLVHRIFVIGGARLYREALDHPACSVLHWTAVEGRHGCDVFVPAPGPAFRLVEEGERQEESGLAYRFRRYERRPAV